MHGVSLDARCIKVRDLLCAELRKSVPAPRVSLSHELRIELRRYPNGSVLRRFVVAPHRRSIQDRFKMWRTHEIVCYTFSPHSPGPTGGIAGQNIAGCVLIVRFIRVVYSRRFSRVYDARPPRIREIYMEKYVGGMKRRGMNFRWELDDAVAQENQRIETLNKC